MNPAQWRSTDYLFVFGSLMDADVLELVSGMPVSELTLTPATVTGYRQCEVIEESYPVLVASETSSAGGRLISGLSTRALQRILFFEGEEYSLHPIEVVCDAEQPRAAFYFSDTGAYTVRESMWDFDLWRQTHKSSFLEASRDYMALFGKMTATEADVYWTKLTQGDTGANDEAPAIAV